jgi:hypothetical protein
MTLYNTQLSKIKRSRDEQRFWDDLDFIWMVVHDGCSQAEIESEIGAFLDSHDDVGMVMPNDVEYPKYVVVGLLGALSNLLAKKKAA